MYHSTLQMLGLISYTLSASASKRIAHSLELTAKLTAMPTIPGEQWRISANNYPGSYRHRRATGAVKEAEKKW